MTTNEVLMKELEKSPATGVILMYFPSSDKERWRSAGERMEEGEGMEKGEGIEEGEKIKDGSKKKIDNSCGNTLVIYTHYRPSNVPFPHTLQTSQ